MRESFRYKILRGGVEYAEIFAVSAPVLRMDNHGEIKTSLQGTFLDRAVDTYGKETNVDWLNDEIKPVMIIDGVSYPLGVFMPATTTPTRVNSNRTIDLQAYDRCWKVQDNKVEGFVYLSAGTKYTDAIEQLLVSSGIDAVVMSESEEVLKEDRSNWETGTSYLEIVNDLLKEINYNSLYFNENGVAVIQPIVKPSASNINHIFTSKKTDTRIEQEAQLIKITPSIKRSTDVFTAPNVFVVVCSNPDKDSPMIATSENNNLRSPLSIPRRGRRIVSVENIDNIASQAELQKYVDIKRDQSMYTGETIEVSTKLLPGFSVNDITAIDDEDVFGICRETSWFMPLQAGQLMTHTLERIVINLD